MIVKDFQYLWSYDPASGSVAVKDCEADHPADYAHHSDIEVNHPERVDGYALPITNGWRIMDKDMSEADPYITTQVKRALAHQASPPMPQIRYHGDPGAPEYHHFAHAMFQGSLEYLKNAPSA